MNDAMSQGIINKIVEFAGSQKPDEMVNYLKKELQDGCVTAQQVLNFAKQIIFKNRSGSPYVIVPSIINKLGVAVSGLSNTEQSKLSFEFYKLAAERGSSWGCRNYATALLADEKNKKQALAYAEKALEYSKDNKTEKDEHKLVYCKALRANHKWKEASVPLLEYFDAKYAESKSFLIKTTQVKEKAKKEAESALELCRETVDDIVENFEHSEDLEKDHFQFNLERIEPFFKAKHLANFSDESRAVLQEAYYIKAKCHEILEQYPEAMRAYCARVMNKEYSRYDEVVGARARLLKQQVSADVVVQNKRSKLMELVLPQGIPMADKFSAKWVEEASWFHSVDDQGVKAEFEKRAAQLKQLKAAKKVEIELLNEGLNALPEDACVLIEEKKKSAEEDLQMLRDAKRKLKEKHEEATSSLRQVFRRHAAESTFFNPRRTKKREALVELTHAIIDHRFQSGELDTPLEPIDLEGKSARLLITAERLFQQAAVELTGEENPVLGIPRAKEKSWAFDNGHSGTTGFGPVECYQMGETEIKSEHRTSPKRNRLGDSFLPQHGTYNGSIYPFLEKLAEKSRKKEKQLATFMIRYGKNHTPVSLEELQAIYVEATQEDVNTFNQICFLILDKEQAQWHSAVDKQFHLGMCVSQARCLIMVRAEFMSFEEVFKNNVLFGVYSQTEILKHPEKVAKSCKRIDQLYLAYLQRVHSRDHFSFLKKHIDGMPRSCVLTREQAHLDMQEVYGGKSDTEDSDNGYESDFSMSPRVSK